MISDVNHIFIYCFSLLIVSLFNCFSLSHAKIFVANFGKIGKEERNVGLRVQ